MNYPQISIIVPVYNVEQYLSRCIDSILSQTYTNFELILVNDGSTDSSGEICDRYAKIDNRIQVHHSQNNGVSIARNIGINCAKGDWITFVDSDDWIENNLFTEITQIVNQYPTDIICWNYYINKEKREVVQHFKDNSLIIKSTQKEIFDLFLMSIYPAYFKFTNNANWDMFSIWNKAYSKTFLNKFNIRFNPQLKRSEDVLFNASCLRNTTCVILINKCFTHYVIRDSSAMTSHDPNLFLTLKTSANILYSILPSNNKVVMQCYLCRCMGYIHEYFRKSLWDNSKMKTREKIQNLSILCEPIKNSQVDINGNVIALKNKLIIWLIKLQAYRYLFLYLNLREFIKVLLKN